MHNANNNSQVREPVPVMKGRFEQGVIEYGKEEKWNTVIAFYIKLRTSSQQRKLRGKGIKHKEGIGNVKPWKCEALKPSVTLYFD